MDTPENQILPKQVAWISIWAGSLSGAIAGMLLPTIRAILEYGFGYLGIGWVSILIPSAILGAIFGLFLGLLVGWIGYSSSEGSATRGRKMTIIVVAVLLGLAVPLLCSLGPIVWWCPVQGCPGTM